MQTQYLFLLLSAFASVFYASDVWAATCTATPECASLGYKYSKEECPRGGLKCPTGDGYYCPTPRPKCHIGDIFYTDNTCVAASNHNSSKTVLGIVVYVNSDGIGGQIMTPWWIDANGNRSNTPVNMTWGPHVDVSELPNMTSEEIRTRLLLRVMRIRIRRPGQHESMRRQQKLRVNGACRRPVF